MVAAAAALVAAGVAVQVVTAERAAEAAEWLATAPAAMRPSLLVVLPGLVEGAEEAAALLLVTVLLLRAGAVLEFLAQVLVGAADTQTHQVSLIMAAAAEVAVGAAVVFMAAAEAAAARMAAAAAVAGLILVFHATAVVAVQAQFALFGPAQPVNFPQLAQVISDGVVYSNPRRTTVRASDLWR
jgi:hypothetical protein